MYLSVELALVEISEAPGVPPDVVSLERVRDRPPPTECSSAGASPRLE
jgi:hypothetical protein